jgi:nicotinate-nucleotide pyrophosphorylase (carboxylating)
LLGQGVFVARAAGVLAGLPAAAIVLEMVDPRLEFQPQIADGSPIAPGDRLAVVAGPMRSLLTAERTALNFVQRLSGVATLTRRYVDAVAGLPCRILDTRKTTPGWRRLEKYAVRQGGGHNHRLGLYDAILIKDNHLAALQNSPDGAWAALRSALNFPRSPEIVVEIEVDTLQQLDVALACRPHMILLDNMSLDDLLQAVQRRNQVDASVLLEASGGVNLTSVRTIAQTGVDCISVGALTHSAQALDIALDYDTGVT